MGRKKIEAIYPLSPQQQGMLFESLSGSEPGMFVEQHVYELKGMLNLPAFRRAWQSIVARHAALRTAFVWSNVEEPLQVVLQESEVPLEQHDWRDLSSSAQRSRLEQYLGEDSRRSFELTKAPLMRLALIRSGEMAHHFVWTLHHILMDGWCFPVIAGEFASAYQAFCDGREVQAAPSRPYRDYVAWLKRQDLRKAESYWRKALEGFDAPTPLGRADRPVGAHGPQGRYGSRAARLPADLTDALQAAARRRRLTLNTLVQGAWALLLSRYSGERDVVFGTTVSGRPPEMEGVETMIGLFINTLPFRATVPTDARLWPWLEELQRLHTELRDYEYCSTGQVHQWSAMPATLPLYESLLVYENYPAGIAPPEAAQEAGYRFTGARTAYPLTLLVSAAGELAVVAVFDGTRLDGAGVARMLEHYLDILRAIASDAEQDVAALLSLIPDWQVPSFRAHARGGRAAGGDFVAPQTEAEEVLAKLAAEVLGLERVGLDDNFFRLGGHSLVIMQLMSRARAAFQVELPVRRLFQTPTVRGWAETVETTLWASRGAARPAAAEGYEEGEL